MQAAAESLLKHEWDAAVTRSELLAIWGLPNNPERFLVTSSWHLQSSFASVQEIISSAGKAEFLIWLKGVNFCGVIFCVFFFLRELIFADRGQSAKFAKIRTCKIFMLHGFELLIEKPSPQTKLYRFWWAKKTKSSFSPLRVWKYFE